MFRVVWLSYLSYSPEYSVVQMDTSFRLRKWGVLDSDKAFCLRYASLES